jgi:hypothetical protein
MSGGGELRHAERLVVDRALDTTVPGGYPLDRLVAGMKETRCALGLTQARLARLAGMSQGRVWRVENGRSREWRSGVRLRLALTLLELSVPPEDLDAAVERVDRAVGAALTQPVCTTCEEMAS